MHQDYSCWTLSHPHWESKTIVGVSQSNLVTTLAALFWTICKDLMRYFSHPPQREMRETSLLMKTPSAIIFLVLNVATFPTSVRAKTHLFRDLPRLSLPSRMCSAHFKSWCTQPPKSFSAGVGVIVALGVTIETAMSFPALLFAFLV